jgi:hypothetical protein
MCQRLAWPIGGAHGGPPSLSDPGRVLDQRGGSGDRRCQKNRAGKSAEQPIWAPW